MPDPSFVYSYDSFREDLLLKNTEIKEKTRRTRDKLQRHEAQYATMLQGLLSLTCNFPSKAISHHFSTSPPPPPLPPTNLQDNNNNNLSVIESSHSAASQSEAAIAEFSAWLRGELSFMGSAPDADAGGAQHNTLGPTGSPAVAAPMEESVRDSSKPPLAEVGHSPNPPGAVSIRVAVATRPTTSCDQSNLLPDCSDRSVVATCSLAIHATTGNQDLDETRKDSKDGLVSDEPQETARTDEWDSDSDDYYPVPPAVGRRPLFVPPLLSSMGQVGAGTWMGGEREPCDYPTVA
eukprot:GHVS01075495.1.p1 GENE.GHVS01075495.1~~GHVS01075495.1.p1  ORF type:complete len:313 (-),score=77.79 GHVS01075495.1:127-1002(-)